MSKRVKIIISVLVAVLLLTVGTTAVVIAQEEPTPPSETHGPGLIARVAEILGIPQEDLVNAFKQAQQEMIDDALDRALDRAVDEGRITELEANEIRQWLEQRPEALDGLFYRFFSHKKLNWLCHHRLANY